MTDTTILEKPDAGADAGAKGGSDAGSAAAAAGGDAGAAGDKGQGGGDVPDWRAIIAGEDTKALDKLKRFTDPKAFLTSYENTQKALNDPFRVKVPDEKSSDEERAVWARLQKIPDDPSKYEVKLDGDYKLSDDDKEILAPLVKELHAEGGVLAHPKVINAIHNAYAKISEELAAAQAAKAIEFHQTNTEALKKEWGPDYASNVSYAERLVEKYAGEDKQFLKLQMADGTRLGDHPEVVKMFASLGRELLDDHVFVEASRGGADGLQTLEAEKKGIMDLWAKGDMKGYAAKGPRLQEINAALARAKSRGK